MEKFPSVTWFEIDFFADSVALESIVTQQPAPGMGLLAAVLPLRPGYSDYL